MLLLFLREQARDSILGVTLVNDLSGRDPQRESIPNLFKKGCDSFLPVGPAIRIGELGDFVFALSAHIDGVEKQKFSTLGENGFAPVLLAGLTEPIKVKNPFRHQKRESNAASINLLTILFLCMGTYVVGRRARSK